MTEDEARKLAQRIIDTWPLGPRAYIWRDILLPLDPHIAANVYRTIRDNNTTPPTPAHYLLTYKQAIARTIHTDQPTLPLDNVIGFADYLTRLQTRHDTAANEELEHWQRIKPRLGRTP